MAVLEAREAFEAEQTAAYAREDELYWMYQEGMGEEAKEETCVAVSEEQEWAFL
jgi:hypothetical protein